MLDRISNAETRAREAEARARAAVERIERSPVTPIEPAPAVAAQPAAGAPGASVSLNSATFEELRSLGMSVTQTGRVLAYRERNQGFKSVDGARADPGFPPGFVNAVRDRVAP